MVVNLVSNAIEYGADVPIRFVVRQVKDTALLEVLLGAVLQFIGVC